MSNPEQSEPNGHAELDPVPRGHPIIAWAVILALVLRIIFGPGREPEVPDALPGNATGGKVTELLGKHLVGAAEMMRTAGMKSVDSAQIIQQAQPLNTGPIDNRLCFVVVVGELAGASEAIKQLAHLSKRLERNGIEPTAHQSQVMNALSRLYADYQADQWDAASLEASERELLTRELDWFGRLALVPTGGADKDARTAVLAAATRTTITVTLAFVSGTFLAMAGCITLVVFIVVLARGRIGSRLTTGSMGGGLYAETFAVWMLLLQALTYFVSLIPLQQPTRLPTLTAFLLSLSAIAWPVLRGVSWNHVRQDIGLTAGSRPYLEPLWGLVCYISTLPLVAIGMIVMMALLQLQGFMGEPRGDNFDHGATPSHPIVGSPNPVGGNCTWYLRSPVLRRRWSKKPCFAVYCIVICETRPLPGESG